MTKTYKSCPCAVEGPHSGGESGQIYNAGTKGAPFIFMTCKHHDHVYQLGFTKLTPEEMIEYVPEVAYTNPEIHFGGFVLDYDSKCPSAGIRCSGPISGKVFHWKTSFTKRSKWFTGCEKHTKDYLKSCKSGIYELVHDPDNNYDLYKPKKFPLFKPKEINGFPTVEVAIEPGLNPGLYHMIYRFGSVSYHFCTYADSGEVAKEKLIEAEKYNYDQNFPEEIRKGKANLVSAGVWKIGQY